MAAAEDTGGRNTAIAALESRTGHSPHLRVVHGDPGLASALDTNPIKVPESWNMDYGYTLTAERLEIEEPPKEFLEAVAKHYITRVREKPTTAESVRRAMEDPEYVKTAAANPKIKERAAEIWNRNRKEFRRARERAEAAEKERQERISAAAEDGLLGEVESDTKSDNLISAEVESDRVSPEEKRRITAERVKKATGNILPEIVYQNATYALAMRGILCAAISRVVSWLKNNKQPHNAQNQTSDAPNPQTMRKKLQEGIDAVVVVLIEVYGLNENEFTGKNPVKRADWSDRDKVLQALREGNTPFSFVPDIEDMLEQQDPTQAKPTCMACMRRCRHVYEVPTEKRIDTKKEAEEAKAEGKTVLCGNCRHTTGAGQGNDPLKPLTASIVERVYHPAEEKPFCSCECGCKKRVKHRSMKICVRCNRTCKHAANPDSAKSGGKRKKKGRKEGK